MKPIFTILFFLAGSSVFSQDLTGIWRGSFTDMMYARDANGKRISIPADQYKFEVQIAQKGNNFEGVTYSYRTTVFYGKATMRGTVNQKNGKVFLEELKLVEVRMAANSGACAMTLFMQYSKSGKEQFLEGTFTAMNVADSTRCPGGKVFLRKVPISDFYKEPIVAQREKEIQQEKERLARARTHQATHPPAASVKKPATRSSSAGSVAASGRKPVKKPAKTPVENEPELRSSPVKSDIAKEDESISVDRKKLPAMTPPELVSRENELVKTIVTGQKQVFIRIYDNGTIDNDTISVFLDKKLVISKARLTDKPIRLTVNLDDADAYHELVMVADNLGDIPPNTSLMVVNAGDKEYEVRISSTEQKNAVIIFKYQKS